MNKKRLNKEEIEFITKRLKEGKPLPDSYRYMIPFETKKEYELTYADKKREEDILSDTMRVPLQPVKTFSNHNVGVRFIEPADRSNKDWTNRLIFGNNLQVLKELTYDRKVKGKVKLIYIDPPFGTGDIYDAKGNAPAYSAKLQGAKFIEFLRERLIFLKELLSDDGSIYVRTDYHFGHYLKAIMDEIFGKNNFQNEIAVKRTRTLKGESGRFHTAMDSIFFYAFANHTFHGFRTEKEIPKWVEMHLPGERKDKDLLYRVFWGERLKAPEGRRWALSQTALDNAILRGLVRKNPQGGLPQFLTKYETLGSNWTDISGYSKHWNYPTENSEQLLERIINASSNPGDLILDAFAGSGTTGAVTEKVGRRWIMIDCGKLAIYTMQKRMLSLKKEIGNKGKSLRAKPFTLYNAGLYNYKMIKELPYEKYREFVLKLFQCRDEKHTIAGIELDGYLGADNVLIFNYQEYKNKNVVLDRGFVDDLHKILGNKIGYRFFIIAPAASVAFLEDYIEKGKTKYFLLRIPYSIIDELHKKGFTHIKQPVSEMDVNATVDAVGFDFIWAPDVECNYLIRDRKGQLKLKKSNKEIVIKIKKFKSNILSKKPQKFENLETLSMVMVDYDYQPEVFDLDEVFYADDLKKNNYEISFDLDKVKDQIMLIYIDIFGNEKREVKKIKDFRKR